MRIQALDGDFVKTGVALFTYTFVSFVLYGSSVGRDFARLLHTLLCVVMEMARIDTNMTETRFVCDFVVRNFEQLLASHPVGRSMSVPFCTYDMFKADFHVYPNGVEGDPGFLVTSIVRTDDIPKPVTASFGVKLLHPGLPISVHSCKDFKERTWDPETEHMDFRHVSVDAIRNHYLDETGSIILRVEFTLKTSLKECDDRQRINTNYINVVGSLLQSHTFSDVF